VVAIVPGIEPHHLIKEPRAMISVECPWCAGSATIEVADRDEFSCAGCAIQVELAPEAAVEAGALAA
jgi:hypothetical protein